MAEFTSIPILDYNLLSEPETRPVFIQQLQDALINVGFLYLDHPPVPTALFDEIVKYTPRLFDLPQERKDALRTANSPCFFGYTHLGVERTRGVLDQREQFDFGTPLADPTNGWTPGAPDYLRLWGDSQYPKEEDLPGFRATFERYMMVVENLSYEFTKLVAEALGLGPDGLARFYDARERIQHRVKLIKYPTRDKVATELSLGAHYDPGFFTFLLQVTDHHGLQAQNLAGQWIDVPPLPYTFVINIGKALETATQGLARATSHRVLAPPAGPSPRYSLPFNQSIGQQVRLSDHVLEIPPEVLKLKGQRGSQTDALNFSEYDRLPSGQVHLVNRCKSYPFVAEKHYPELFKQIFPNGMPTNSTNGTAY